MSFINIFNFQNILLLYLYYVLLSMNLVFAGVFIDIIKIPLKTNYFVVLDSGLYLYNFNNLDCSIIQKFNSSVYRQSNNKINLTELEDEFNSYIFCLVNEYLFIFNSRNNKTLSYKLNEINTNKNYYYNLMPHKIKNNNISFILAYYIDNIKLSFYYYNFNKDNICQPKITSFNDIHVINNMIRCHINSRISIIKCFYYEKVNNKDYLSSVEFLIKDMDIINKDVKNIEIMNTINQIKLALSYNNNYLICYTFPNSKKHSNPYCYINTYSSNSFRSMNCNIKDDIDINYDSRYRVLYFNETGDFVFISRLSLKATILKSFDNSVSLCYQDIFSRQENDNSIIYINEYKLITYNNFTNYMKCNNIPVTNDEQEIITTSLLKYDDIITTNIINPTIFSKYSEELYPLYIKEYTNKSRIEIFNTIDDVLKNKKIGINYEIEGKDFIITIKPTNSTIFEDKTKVDFNECEKLVRGKYNISNSSIISFFQMEINNNENKALYNQIKYLTFDEQKRILDLSICDNIDINYVIKNNTKVNISAINDFKEHGIDLLDIKDNFFNDLCYPYSESKKDVILEDRIKYFYQNYSLCEIGCSHNNTDFENMTIICNCKIQGIDNESLINIAPLFFAESKDISFFDSNIGVIKCYNLIFSMNNIL